MKKTIKRQNTRRKIQHNKKRQLKSKKLIGGNYCFYPDGYDFKNVCYMPGSYLYDTRELQKISIYKLTDFQNGNGNGNSNYYNIQSLTGNNNTNSKESFPIDHLGNTHKLLIGTRVKKKGDDNDKIYEITSINNDNNDNIVILKEPTYNNIITENLLEFVNKYEFPNTTNVNNTPHKTSLERKGAMKEKKTGKIVFSANIKGINYKKGDKLYSSEDKRKIYELLEFIDTKSTNTHINFYKIKCLTKLGMCATVNELVVPIEGLGIRHIKINTTVEIDPPDELYHSERKYITSLYDTEKYYIGDLITKSVKDIEYPKTNIYMITDFIENNDELFYRIQCITDYRTAHCTRKINEDEKFAIDMLGTYHRKIHGEDLYKTDEKYYNYVYGIYDNIRYYIGDYVMDKENEEKIYKITDFVHNDTINDRLCIMKLKSSGKSFWSNNLYTLDLIKLVINYKKIDKELHKTKKNSITKRLAKYWAPFLGKQMGRQTSKKTNPNNNQNQNLHNSNVFNNPLYRPATVQSSG